jgi:hypothetical protein
MAYYDGTRIENSGKSKNGTFVPCTIGKDEIDIRDLNQLLYNNQETEDDIINRVLDLRGKLLDNQEEIEKLEEEQRLHQEAQREKEERDKQVKAEIEAQDKAHKKALDAFEWLQKNVKQDEQGLHSVTIPRDKVNLVNAETFTHYLELQEKNISQLPDEEEKKKATDRLNEMKLSFEWAIKTIGNDKPETAAPRQPQFTIPTQRFVPPEVTRTATAAVVPPPTQTGTTTPPLSVQELRDAARARIDGGGGNKKSKKNRRNKQAGGRVLMPIQYFGGQLNRYYPAGSPQLNPLPSAYGQTVARSFGTTEPTLLKLNATAPNLGPMGLGSNGENMSCGVQTGGGRKRTLKTRNQIKLRQKKLQ